MNETPLAPLPHPSHTVVELVRLRHELCQALRHHLVESGAVEVTTPVLHGYPDIAPMEQFTTRHPATGQRSFLRIAPTEHLKRLIAAGLEHVFEFSVNFRPDAVDETHLPEFTSLEIMLRDASCKDMEQLAMECCQIAYEVARRAVRATMLPVWLLSAAPTGRLPVTRLPLADELHQRFQLSRADLFEVNALREVAIRLGDGEAHAQEHTLASLMDRIVTALTSGMDGLVLVTGFPCYLGGPAAPDLVDPRFKQRAELFVGGVEIANMSSNLIDIEALRAWHKNGVRAKSEHGITTNRLDEPLLADLGNDFPESAVLGIGIERLLLTFFGLHDVGELRQIC